MMGLRILDQVDKVCLHKLLCKLTGSLSYPCIIQFSSNNVFTFLSIVSYFSFLCVSPSLSLFSYSFFPRIYMLSVKLEFAGECLSHK